MTALVVIVKDTTEDVAASFFWVEMHRLWVVVGRPQSHCESAIESLGEASAYPALLYHVRASRAAKATLVENRSCL